MFRHIPFDRVNWPTSLFLGSTLLLTLTAVPAYLWCFGMDAFQLGLFLIFFAATGLSITTGYHRLLAHGAFRARWPVRLGVLIFGAAAFEGSALDWTSDHRRHHKFVDHEQDPYDISKGFFHAHIGWLLFKLRPQPPCDNVNDLRKDSLVAWQHRYWLAIGAAMSFVVPPALGWAWGGWRSALGALLIGGVARVACVQHSTFFINSFCHYIGNRPYSSKCSARDSWFMALFTFGEGYHNFHHEFQYDYRNGVKSWQFDPTKWVIWLLSKARLVNQLRRVPSEKIALAMITEKQRQLEFKLATHSLSLSESAHALLASAQERLHQAAQNWEQRRQAYTLAAERKIEASKERIAELRRECEQAAANLREAIRLWHETHRWAVGASGA